MDKAEMEALLVEQGWMYRDEIIKQYGIAEYYNYKMMSVNPRNITVLSDKDVLTTSKLQNLKERIINDGWNDTFGINLSLTYLPNRTYMVNTEGNHRVCVAKLLEIKKIQANVTIMLPYSMLHSSAILSLERMELERNDYQDRVDELNLEFRMYYRHTEEIPLQLVKIRTELYDNLTRLDDKRNFLLHNEAKRLELFPDRPRLKITIKKKNML